MLVAAEGRNVYLSNIELGEAERMFFEGIKEFMENPGTEKVDIQDSVGRVTAEPVFAKLSSPFFNASAMDGIAVKAEKTYPANERNPVRLKKGEDFVFIDTGDPIKDPFDSVVMIEDVVELDEETAEIIKSVSPWENVRPVGEDIVAGEMIIPAYHKVTPVDIGAMLSGGLLQIGVVKKPRVAIIPTGTEIIEPGEAMEEGNIIDSNSRVFEAIVNQCGGCAVRYKPVKDDYVLIRAAVSRAVEENDIVLINAGSSAGSEDFTVKVVRDIGQVLAHGIAIKPGKPAILGEVDGKPVIGIPGYPVSAYFVFDVFVKPLIYKYLRQSVSQRPVVETTASKRMVSSLKHVEFVRVKLGKVDGRLIATPLSRGAGVTMSLVKADGILSIPRNSEGVEAGELVRVELLKDISDIENTIVSIGSHDIILDILANIIHISNPGILLSSAHVGSLAGLMAVKRGEAHIAPIHLLDEKTGTYNTEYARKYLKGMKVSLIKGVKRVQGFMVNKGNIKNIRIFEDLRRKDVVYVNRQKGSGTRILLDYKLKEQGIDAAEITGYEREMTTHVAVASAVLSGTADAGMGVKSAANVMGLDFIPLGVEEYDFLVPDKFLEEEIIQEFIEGLKSQEFINKVSQYGGYEIENPGEIVRID